jgi:hypothetical protein
VVGYWGATEAQIIDFVYSYYVADKPAREACMVDDNGAVNSAYGATKDDLWVIDKTGNVVFYSNAGVHLFSNEPYRTQIDTAVRAALQ